VRLVVLGLAVLAGLGLVGLERAELGLVVEAILAELAVVGGWVQVAVEAATQGTAAVEAGAGAGAGDTVPILGTLEAAQDTVQDIAGVHELLPTGNFLHRM